MKDDIIETWPYKALVSQSGNVLRAIIMYDCPWIQELPERHPKRSSREHRLKATLEWLEHHANYNRPVKWVAKRKWLNKVHPLLKVRIAHISRKEAMPDNIKIFDMAMELGDHFDRATADKYREFKKLQVFTEVGSD